MGDTGEGFVLVSLKDDLVKLAQESNPEIAELRKALVRAQKQLQQAKQRSDELVEATIQASKDAVIALGPIPATPTPSLDKRKTGIEVALWHLTDWQGAKKNYYLR